MVSSQAVCMSYYNYSRFILGHVLSLFNNTSEQTVRAEFERIYVLYNIRILKRKS